MGYHLNIDWTTGAHQDAPAQLTDVQATVRDAAGHHLPADFQGRRLHFAQLAPGFYTLHLSYGQQGVAFDSFAFGFEVPDMTLMKCQLTPAGTVIEQYGALNDYGEFMDMRLSEETLYLTRAVRDFAVWQALTPHVLPGVTPLLPELNQAIGPLAQAFAALEHLWAYQLRALLQPTLLAQASVAGLAVLQHLLSNHLALMDDERLQEHLLVAIESESAGAQVEQLLDDLCWNPLTQSWDGLPDFLQALGTQTLLKY